MINDFETVAVFEYSAEAQMLKSKLESEGIEVFLKDEYTVDSDPLISQAIGGVKLQVHVADKERARVIYNEVRVYVNDKKGNPIQCPKCKEEKVIYDHRSSTNIFFMLFPFLEGPRYECVNCQSLFKLK